MRAPSQREHKCKGKSSLAAAAFHHANASRAAQLPLSTAESQFYFALQRSIHHFPPAQTHRGCGEKVAGGCQGKRKSASRAML
jgi:hypothetical protein